MSPKDTKPVTKTFVGDRTQDHLMLKSDAEAQSYVSNSHLVAVICNISFVDLNLI